MDGQHTRRDCDNSVQLKHQNHCNGGPKRSLAVVLLASSLKRPNLMCYTGAHTQPKRLEMNSVKEAQCNVNKSKTFMQRCDLAQILASMAAATGDRLHTMLTEHLQCGNERTMYTMNAPTCTNALTPPQGSCPSSGLAGTRLHAS